MTRESERKKLSTTPPQQPTVCGPKLPWPSSKWPLRNRASPRRSKPWTIASSGRPSRVIVVSKDAQVGEMVSPNSAGGGFTRTGIATIVDMNSNEIEVDVNESYIARVKEGQAVRATLDAFPDAPYDAKVRTVIPTADRQKATVKVRISFLKLDDKILPDMGVKVAFLEEPKPAASKKGAEKVPEAVAYIPKSAVRSDSNASFVYLMKDGAVERRAVTIGTDRGTDVGVLGGLAPGDSIVVKGPENLRDGEKVEIGQ